MAGVGLRGAVRLIHIPARADQLRAHTMCRWRMPLSSRQRRLGSFETSWVMYNSADSVSVSIDF